MCEDLFNWMVRLTVGYMNQGMDFTEARWLRTRVLDAMGIYVYYPWEFDGTVVDSNL